MELGRPLETRADCEARTGLLPTAIETVVVPAIFNTTPACAWSLEIIIGDTPPKALLTTTLEPVVIAEPPQIVPPVEEVIEREVWLRLRVIFINTPLRRGTFWKKL